MTTDVERQPLGQSHSMTREALRDTLNKAIARRSRYGDVEQALDLAMAAVELHVVLRLRERADYLDALPPGGEALVGPYWYQQGIHDAAGLLRDEVDRIEYEAEQRMLRASTDRPRTTGTGYAPTDDEDRMT
ncbi:hypothetical protein [Streptomyces benahoarensis]|uniref:Uncharacterized protein n=1 Tax=Streptomyces benahoarensis TaxID=2595054 RepID=A0A553ZQ87_9ACTN|nr:hypothetical protein [Streptomyces benahoarensis]TSB32075.1 hypothetical protein FNJ62_03325 [Streptomyces benahoarensis]TSB43612.1 hypothetical protein FNZ23_03375 [Streptomyces benahoarensis]